MSLPDANPSSRPLRVLVCGSREFGNSDQARAAISHELLHLPDDTVIIHGAARGVDTWADAIAWECGIEVEEYPADWERYGKRAGIIRNVEMLETQPDLVLAFWNGSSRGTLHTITEARARGIETRVIPLEPSNE